MEAAYAASVVARPEQGSMHRVEPKVSGNPETQPEHHLSKAKRLFYKSMVKAGTEEKMVLLHSWWSSRQVQ